MNSHIIVNRDQMSIRLVTDERNHFCTRIFGQLTYHPDFLKFGINQGEYMTPRDMAHLIKMNRSCFENHDVAMKLVKDLTEFKAKVNSQIENSDNNRGDKRLLLEQTVTSNLPESFKLCIPVFKGMKKETFEVEVYIRSEDMTCTLVSPGANDFIASVRDLAIDATLADIAELRADIVVLEQ